MKYKNDPFIELVDWLVTPVRNDECSKELFGLCQYLKINSWLELFLYYYSEDKEMFDFVSHKVLEEIAKIADNKGLYEERYFRIFRVYYLNKIDISDLFTPNKRPRIKK